MLRSDSTQTVNEQTKRLGDMPDGHQSTKAVIRNPDVVSFLAQGYKGQTHWDGVQIKITRIDHDLPSFSYVNFTFFPPNSSEPIEKQEWLAKNTLLEILS